MDIGCSNHMSGFKHSFATLDVTYSSTVMFGDNSSVEMKGKGSIKLNSRNGFVELIFDVLYVLA